MCTGQPEHRRRRVPGSRSSRHVAHALSPGCCSGAAPREAELRASGEVLGPIKRWPAARPRKFTGRDYFDSLFKGLGRRLGQQKGKICISRVGPLLWAEAAGLTRVVPYDGLLSGGPPSRVESSGSFYFPSRKKGEEEYQIHLPTRPRKAWDYNHESQYSASAGSMKIDPSDPVLEFVVKGSDFGILI